MLQEIKIFLTYFCRDLINHRLLSSFYFILYLHMYINILII